MGNAITTFSVLWKYEDQHGTETKISRVMIIDGYSTVDDLPKIIAMNRWQDPRKADQVKIISKSFISRTPQT